MLTITREMKKKHYSFSINTTKNISGKANYTFGLLLQKITIVSSKSVLQLKQTNWILKLLNAFPILNSEVLAPYKFYVNGRYCGKSKNVFLEPCFFFDIENKRYEVRLHNNNIISLMMNNTQIALFEKETSSRRERNIYKIRHSTEHIEKEMLLLFCAFADLVFYENESFVSYYKIEKNYVLNDKYAERTKWEAHMGATLLC